MPLKVGLLGVGHVHAPSYVHCLQHLAGADYVGHWDKDSAVSMAFGKEVSGTPLDRDELVGLCDAVVVAGENLDHAELVEVAAANRKAVLCEKPLAANADQARRIRLAIEESGVLLMTALPCPYSTAFESAIAKVEGGEIGKVLSVCATNHGKCPFGWFTDPSKSGGGAMIDHVVHVADLLRRLIGEEPQSVHAFTGNNVYAGGFEDTAMLTIAFPSGVFASLDASWSRPKGYKAWGDVTLKIVGEKGVIELDLFLQAADWYGSDPGAHGLVGFGSNLDMAMVSDFLHAVETGAPPRVSMHDGLVASSVAIAGYASAKSGQPVAIGDLAAASR